MQDNSIERMGASPILKFFKECLEHSNITFVTKIHQAENVSLDNTHIGHKTYDDWVSVDEPSESTAQIPENNCPIYFTGNNGSTVVLPPASILPDTMDTLDEMLEKIKKASNPETFRGKNIVIPIAKNIGGSMHFVTLFYNADTR